MSDESGVAALFRLCPPRRHAVPLAPNPAKPHVREEAEQEAPGAVSWLPVSEGPWTRARILAKTTWIVPAAFPWEGRGYLPPGQEKDGGPFGDGWGSAPRGIAACVLRVCVPLSQAMPS